MLYLGSKRRIAKYITTILNSHRTKKQIYVEPFVGGANIIEYMDNPRIGYDINPYLIALLCHIRDNPTNLPHNNIEFDENSYNFIRKNYKSLPNFEFPIIGFAGFPLSFGGKWFGGWRRGNNRDYVAESFRNAQQQSKKLQGVIFNRCSYQDIKLTPNSLIYCDPPYRNVTKYSMNFDHNHFFQWCRDCRSEGHQIFVSEYEAPSDFKIIWEKQSIVNFSYNRKSVNQNIEKLFTLD